MADTGITTPSESTARPEVHVGGFFDCLRALKKAEEEAASPYGKGDPVVNARLKELRGYKEVFLKAEAPRRPKFTVVERKADPGSPVPVEIGFSTSVQFYEGLELSLSRGGLFVKTEGLLPIDTVLDVKCTIEDENVSFRMSAKVIWLNPRETQGRPAGMGLKLFRLSTLQRQLITDFLNGEMPTAALANLSEE